MAIRLAEVTVDPIDHTRLVDLVRRPTAGAISLFLGVVRDNDPETSGQVVALNYTCHPSAPGRMAEIVADVVAALDPDGGCEIAVAHRIGRLVVGDSAFVVAVSSPHRRLAMSVCDQVVERVKAELPVWKQQFESDGGYRWSGL